jgi:hypothetical protein
MMVRFGITAAVLGAAGFLVAPIMAAEKPKEIVVVGAKKKTSGKHVMTQPSHSTRVNKVEALTIKQKSVPTGVKSYKIQPAWPTKH